MNKIQNEYLWKETSKKIIDNSNNYNEFQKEMMKLFIEAFYEDRKKSILKNEAQVRYIQSIINSNDYCKCNGSSKIYSDVESDSFGYWDVCGDCNKRIEDGYHPYNHYDGEDHDDIDL